MSVPILAMLWVALRRRPFSFIATIGLCSVSAALCGVGVPAALLIWWLGGVLGLALWLVLEPVALQGVFGCRKPLLAEWVGAEYVHGKDGMGDSFFQKASQRPDREHAVDAIVRLAAERPGELTIMAQAMSGRKAARAAMGTAAE